VIIHPDGKRKYVKDLESDDKILTYDDTKDEFIWDDILMMQHFGVHDKLYNVNLTMIEFTLDNGETLTMTGNHLLFIGNTGLHRADYVQVGDKLKFHDGSYVEVIAMNEVMRQARNIRTYRGTLVINGVAISQITDGHKLCGNRSVAWRYIMRQLWKYGYSNRIGRFIISLLCG